MGSVVGLRPIYLISLQNTVLAADIAETIHERGPARIVFARSLADAAVLARELPYTSVAFMGMEIRTEAYDAAFEQVAALSGAVVEIEGETGKAAASGTHHALRVPVTADAINDVLDRIELARQ